MWFANVNERAQRGLWGLHPEGLDAWLHSKGEHVVNRLFRPSDNTRVIDWLFPDSSGGSLLLWSLPPDMEFSQTSKFNRMTAVFLWIRWSCPMYQQCIKRVVMSDLLWMWTRLRWRILGLVCSISNLDNRERCRYSILCMTCTDFLTFNYGDYAWQVMEYNMTVYTCTGMHIQGQNWLKKRHSYKLTLQKFPFSSIFRALVSDLVLVIDLVPVS